MPGENTRFEWFEFCSRCGSETSGFRPDDGCPWECATCGIHQAEESLEIPETDEDIPFEALRTEHANVDRSWWTQIPPPGGWGWYVGADSRGVAQILVNPPAEQSLRDTSTLDEWAEEHELVVVEHENSVLRYVAQANNTFILCEQEGCETQAIGSRFCDEHGVLESCTTCPYSVERGYDEEGFLVDAEGNPYCNTCATRLCPSCNSYSRQALTYSHDADLYVCRRCFLGADEAESFDDDAEIRNRQLVIPVIPGRENIRMCGVEIEGGNGHGNGEDLAARLYDDGLSAIDGVASYHHGSDGFAHVERDSSVDWEAVIGPLNPAVQADVSKLNRVMRLIRGMVKDGTLTLDLRAGCHIHVEAARTSLDGAFNLNTLFAYAEDVIFRLGAARWPIHRAISDSHYTQPIPKENRKVQFARAHAEDDGARYFALSFNNYFSQMLNRCRCGATRYDSWEDCTCNLGKCTFEFRVFNTTANPRKLHAYLALTQALVAKAMEMGKLDNPAEEFPVHAFVSRRFKDMGSIEQEEIVEEWRERLTWLFNELPLTDEEKDSLGYCVRYSELEAVGEDFLNALLPQQKITEEVTA